MKLKLLVIGTLIFNSYFLNASEDDNKLPSEEYCKQLKIYTKNTLVHFLKEDINHRFGTTPSDCNYLSHLLKLANEANKCQLIWMQFRLAKAIKFCENRKKRLEMAEEQKKNQKKFLNQFNKK